jgi:hypothetical protein
LAAVAVAGAVAVSATLISAPHAVAAQTRAAHAGRAPAQARAARALSVTDTARLHYVSASGSLLYEVGQAAGTLPGRMRAHIDLGPTMHGSFTIYARDGSISGRGSASVHGSGVYESFAGSIVATAGSGRYTHAHGRARLYGLFNRNDYSFTVQTIGVLHY